MEQQALKTGNGNGNGNWRLSLSTLLQTDRNSDETPFLLLHPFSPAAGENHNDTQFSFLFFFQPRLLSPHTLRSI